MSDFPNLETARLVLREIAASDASSLLSILSDANAMQWLGANPLVSYEEATQLIRTYSEWRAAPTPGTRWAIIQKSTNKFIGTSGLFKWHRTRRSCSVVYELARDARGNGLMSEALTAVLNWGFDNMSLNRIEAQVHPSNKPSLKLLERFGFVREGLLRQAGFWLGKHHDLYQYALLRSEYVSFATSRSDAAEKSA